MERRQVEIRKVYPGLKCFQEGVRQIPVESIPGIREYKGPFIFYGVGGAGGIW